MTAWIAATSTGVLACSYATWRNPRAGVTRGLWSAALGALPGSPLMLAHAIGVAHPNDCRTMLALFGILFGPMAFMESAHQAPPLAMAVYGEVARVLFLASWAASAFCGLMIDAASI